MNRTQALRKIREYCKENDLHYHYDGSEGNGSHGMVYVGDRKTIAKHGEWTKTYLHVVLKQLGVDKDAI